ncbi:MAG: hypothetical protein KTV77_02045 [Wolbachia endosymbiont of Fragariocoptes setiger]|nr:hypothetical protein [Wolbachia endosymbiont of Fragariocoptes setiger]
MIKSISINSKNIVNIELDTKEDLENFIKIFTVLNKHKAAKTLFKNEVNIEYQQHETKEIVQLLNDVEFTYNDIENILHHFSKHGMKLPNDIIACTLASGYNNALKSRDMAFSLYEKSPKFNIKINKNVFILTPMSIEDIKLDSQNSKKLFSLLKNEQNTHSCEIKESIIYITVYSDIIQVINLIVNSLVQSNLLEKNEKYKLQEKLRQIAFKDQAFAEYCSIKTINQYPHYHPLRKHQNITESIEGILREFMSNEDITSTVKKLNKLGVSPDTPSIITKTIGRLVKFH